LTWIINSMTHAFIRYAAEDEDATRPIIEALRQGGLDVESGKIGASEQLDTATCLVVLWSKAAAQSTQVVGEIQQAIKAWSSNRLVLASFDDTPLPVGLRDLSVVSIAGGPDFATKQLRERIQSKVFEHVNADVPISKPLRAKSSRRLLFDVIIAAAILLLGCAILDLVSSLRTNELAKLQAEANTKAKQAEKQAAFLKMAAATAAAEADEVKPHRADPGFSATDPDPGFSAIDPKASEQQLLKEKLRERAQHVADAAADAETESKAAIVEQQRLDELRSKMDAQRRKLGAFSLVLLGAALGAGAVLAWIAWSNRRRTAFAVTFGSSQPVAHQRSPEKVGLSEGQQVFISYSRQDTRTVEQLVKQIEQLGYAVWIDRELYGSQRFAGPIVQAIRKSRLVALMCSQHAYTSDNVIREINVAGECKKPFILFELDLTELPDGVLYFVSGFPRVSVTTLDEQQLQSEITRLVSV
jgi:hypothetical protein